MSKKYKGKPCAYCAVAEAISADHVFAREFFLPRDRVDLPKVPSCGRCNQSKSELEHYLSAVLPFGARHGAAIANLREMVPKRLSGNAQLRRMLSERAKTWAAEHDRQAPVSTLPIEASKVKALFEFIVRGLAVFHWSSYLDREIEVEVLAVPEGAEDYFDRLLLMNAAAKVKADLGHGTFTYEGSQAVDCPKITVWRIRTYGGLQFGDSRQPGAISSCFGAWSRLRAEGNLT